MIVRDIMSVAQQIEDFNDQYLPGHPVILKNSDGSEVETTTCSRAWLIDRKTPVVELEGLPGCHRLDLISPKDAGSD
jgi:hypothetical protein